MDEIKASANVRANLPNMNLDRLEALTNRARRLNMPGDAIVSVINKSTFLSVPQIRITHTLPEDAEYRTRPEFDEGGLPEAKRVIQDGPPYVVYRDRPIDPDGWWDSKVQYWIGAYGTTLTLTEDDRISLAEGRERGLLRDYWPPTGIKPPEYKPDAVDNQVAAVKVTEAPNYVAEDPDNTGIPVADQSPPGWWQARAQSWTDNHGTKVTLTGSDRMSAQEGKARGWHRDWVILDAPEIPRGAKLEPKGKRAKLNTILDKAKEDRDQMASVQGQDGQTMAVLPDAVVAMLGHWWWADEVQFWRDQNDAVHTFRGTKRLSAPEGHSLGWKRYLDTQYQNRDNR